MKIVSLHVVAFGKLKNVELNFNSGLNVIKQVNSFGKTTMAGFIRAMLYGFTYTRTKGVTDVSHFAPWGSTEKFGGSMVVEHDGTLYRIERFFGATARQETLTVTNEKTGKEIYWQKQPGEMLLGLTAESYDRSAYFPQEGVELTSNENLDSRLANLVEDSAEDYDKVQDRLRAYKKKLRYERGLGGEIYELEREKSQLKEQISSSQYAEKRAAEIDRRLNEIAEEKAALTQRHAEYSEQLTKLQGAIAQTQLTVEPQQPQMPQPTPQQRKLNIIAKAVSGLFSVVGLVLIVLGIAQVITLSLGTAIGCLCAAIGCTVIGVVTYRERKWKNCKQSGNEQSVSSQQEQLATDYTSTATNYVNVLTALTEQMGELATETGRLSEERKGLTFNSVELMDRLLTVEEEHKDALHRYEVADTVVRLLEQAKDNLSSSYLPRLCARCSQLLQEITQSQFAVVVDRSFSVSLRENGQTKPMSEFSRGIREITLLCFRVALSELLYDGAVPFVIVDDAFVNFDEDNFMRATNLLRKLSEHAQVIYFTCHNRTGELLK